MQQNKEPLRLEELALQEICTFTSQQCRRLVELARPAADGEVDVSQLDGVPVNKRRKHEQRCVQYDFGSSEAEVTAICDRLKQMLQTDIPPRFADYVTAAILRQVDDMHTQLVEHTEIPEGRLAVLRHVLPAILHPRVQTLDLSFKWKYIAHKVLSEIQRVPNLITLKFTYNKVYDSYDSDLVRALFLNVFVTKVNHVNTGRCLSHLEHLTYEYECSDEMLEGLSETCSQLKTLDINGSFRVTDLSVEYIKKFTHLKVLNLKRTKINREGQRNILTYLCNNNPCQLELYGCTDIDSNHLDTLFQLIPNIRELRTVLVNFDKPTRRRRRFHNLEILRIDYCDGYNISLKNLSKCFPNLQELEITGESIEPTDILRNWSKLNKLFLRSRFLRIDYTLDETYCSLEHLTLVTLAAETPVATLISRSHNLKTLELITESTFYVHELRVLTQLSNLEEVSLGSLGGRVPPETVALLSERCKTTVLLEDPQMASLYEHCPGVRMDNDRWFEITKAALSDFVMYSFAGSCHLKLFTFKADSWPFYQTRK